MQSPLAQETRAHQLARVSSTRLQDSVWGKKRKDHHKAHARRRKYRGRKAYGRRSNRRFRRYSQLRPHDTSRGLQPRIRGMSPTAHPERWGMSPRVHPGVWGMSPPVHPESCNQSMLLPGAPSIVTARRQTRPTSRTCALALPSQRRWKSVSMEAV